ncbi:MAG: hypothetical protein NTV97_05055 [Alphaproteobacteria bacterium]|nr:hypothetical protein [Alphaproteobacteria bacterium]
MKYSIRPVRYLRRLVLVTQATLALCSVLAGCGPSGADMRSRKYEAERQQQIAAQNHSAKAAEQQCEYENKSGKSSAVTFSRCMLEAIQMYYQPSDLHLAAAYKRLQLSEDFAAGKITATQARSQFQDYIALLNAIQIQRENQVRAAQAAEYQAAIQAKMGRCLAERQRAADAEASRRANPPSTDFGQTLAGLGALADAVNVGRECD